MKTFVDRFEEIKGELHIGRFTDEEAIRRLIRKADNLIRKYQGEIHGRVRMISPSERMNEDSCPQFQPSPRVRRVVKPVYECPRCTFSHTNERTVLVHFRAAHSAYRNPCGEVELGQVNQVFSHLRKDRI